MGAFCFGGILFRDAFVLGDFLTGGLWHVGFCQGAFCGGLLTRYRSIFLNISIYVSIKYKQQFIMNKEKYRCPKLIKVFKITKSCRMMKMHM